MSNFVPEDSEEDLAAQAAIRSRANASIAILEKAFIRNGSGRYFVLRTDELGNSMDRGTAEATDVKSA